MGGKLGTVLLTLGVVLLLAALGGEHVLRMLDQEHGHGFGRVQWAGTVVGIILLFLGVALSRGKSAK